MTSSPQADIESPESAWKNQEADLLKAENEKISKMSPQQKEQYLKEEKAKFAAEKQKAKEDLGFKGEVKPLSKEEKAKQSSLEDKERAEELAKLSKPKSSPETDLKSYKEHFAAAVENIEKHKPFQFQSLSINDLGKRSGHEAYMSALIDHSQESKNIFDDDKEHHDVAAGDIWKRLETKAANPWQIGVRISVDLGEDQKNNLGLTNLSLELPLASLLEGHLIEKITRFTNLVFFAAEVHYRKNQNEEPKSPPKDQKVGHEGKVDLKSTEVAQPYGLTSIGTEGGLSAASNLFKLGTPTAAAFSFESNKGSVWGTAADINRIPEVESKFKEALDKVPKEK